MSYTSRERILRALMAAQAVTLGAGLLASGCGTGDTTTERDTGADGGDTGTDGGDASSDVGADVAPDALDGCFFESDGVCPDFCTDRSDADCCGVTCGGMEWAYLDPDRGCSCAVEGPFAPPSLAA
jgi:hypothetical protein